MPPAPHRAVLFDYDDTLVPTRLCKSAAMQALARRSYGVELDDELIARHWGAPYRALFAAVFAGIDADVERLISRYEALTHEFPLDAYPEALGVLTALGARVPVGIVTAAGRDITTQQLRRLGVDPAHLTVFQTADDTPVHKPDPRVFAPALGVLRQRGIEAREVLYVGDSLRDLLAARGAGLAFVGVLRGTTTAREFEQEGAEVLADLTPLLGRVAPEAPAAAQPKDTPTPARRRSCRPRW